VSDDPYAGMVAPAGDEFWPYTSTEANAIKEHLATEKQRALDLIIHSTRIFAAMHERGRTKPNPRAEVLRLEAALRELSLAISGLSADAKDHLKSHKQHGEAYERPMDRAELLGTVHRFMYENKLGFLQRAPTPSAGRIPDCLVQSLVAKFDEAWLIGHGGIKLRIGWPEFFALCWDPLARMKLVGDAAEKGRQKIRTKARRRNSI
jgi:hypothetical protein